MGPTPENQASTTSARTGPATIPPTGTSPDSAQTDAPAPSMPRAEPSIETAEQVRNGAAITPPRSAGQSAAVSTVHRPSYQTRNFPSQDQDAPRPNNVTAQAFEALYGPRGGRLAIDGYSDPDRVANNIYQKALHHNLSMRDLDDVIHLEPARNPEKWNQFQQALRAKTGMSGEVGEILYALNANQMDFQRRQYSSTAPLNLSFMIDRVSPERLAPAPVAHELTFALHDPNIPENERFDNFLTGAMAVTPAERPGIKEEMRRDAKLIAGAFEVLARELSPENSAPNFTAVFKAINGLDAGKLELIEERYDEKFAPRLRERIADLAAIPENHQQTTDLLHMFDYGFDSTWVAEQIIGAARRSENTGDDWTLDEPKKKRITWLLERLTESQMQQVAHQISSPLARKICHSFTNGPQQQNALALLSDNGTASYEPSQPQTSDYPAKALLGLNNALRDRDYALFEKTLNPLSIAQKTKLIDDYNSSHNHAATLGAIIARLGRPEGAGANKDPILHPPEMRANVAPKDPANVDNIDQLWLEADALSGEREQIARLGRPFTKQKSMKQFKGWTDHDYDALVRLASSLGPRGIPPAALMAVFQIESHGGDPTATNRLNGAAGIFQLTKENQRLLGFRNVQAMTVAEQLNEIGPAYFSQHGGSRITTADKLYQAIFIGNPDDAGENKVLYRAGQKAYFGNMLYDRNRNGEITLGESLTKFRHELRKINSDENIMRQIAQAQSRVLGAQFASNDAGSTTSATSNRD